MIGEHPAAVLPCRIRLWDTRSVPTSPANTPRTAPPLWALHILFLMTGTGTTLLGPILPLLMRTWHLHDAQAGVLLAAQFLGAFIGGISVGSHARRELLTASAASILGFACSRARRLARRRHARRAAGSAVAGFGIGHMVTANNIIGGRLPEDRRARTLTLLNLSWSLGAILSPILAAWLLPTVPLHTLLGVFAALFACAGVAVYANIDSPPPIAEAMQQQVLRATSSSSSAPCFCSTAAWRPA